MLNSESSQPRDWVQAVAQQHEAQLLRYARRLTGDEAAARDIVQDTFLKLCSEDREKRGDHIVRWLFHVCRNRALDVLKKETRMCATPARQLDSPCDAADPAERAAVGDEARRALDLLDQLPRNQQEVIRLKLEHDLSYRDIADITGLSISNVGFLLHQGFKTLRSQLSN